MRTTDDLRQRLLERAGQMVKRPGMYATHGQDLDLAFRTLLDDLCFLDERETVAAAISDALGKRYGKLGVSGPFTTMFGPETRTGPEVASVFAEQLHRLGHLAVERRTDPAVWADARTRFDAKDLRRGEVEAAYGPPSLLIDRRVLCYAPSDDSGWIFVDCWSEDMTRYEPGKGRYSRVHDDDPLVREVRLPTERFEDGLVLTLYGRVLRWGPGWWIDHPPPDTTDEQRAVAAQLRTIRDRDPSQ